MPGRAQRGEQVPRQQALGRGLVPGEAEWEQHAVLHQGVRAAQRGQRRRARVATRTRTVATDAATKRPAARAPSRAANIAARTGTASQAVDFRSQATPSATPAPTAPPIREVPPSPRGSPAREVPRPATFPRGGRPAPGPARSARAPRVGGDHRQVEPYHRRGHRDGRGQQRVAAARRTGPVGHRDPERRREHDHRAEGDPHPGVPRQATEPSRARQAEQGHDRQVRVVGQPGGDLRGGQVGRAVVH